MSEKIESINPWTGETIESFDLYSDDKLNMMVDTAHDSFQNWKQSSFEKRSRLMQTTAALLRGNPRKWAEPIVKEMGKPIREALAEIEKCAWVCEYYAENAKDFLKNEQAETDASDSYVRHDPLGVIVGIMPWNYPYWQVLRFAVPTLMAGNVVILKHSTNVSRCALMIAELFVEAGFPNAIFQTILANNEQIKKLLQNQKVRAASLTGSEAAGKSVASTCGSLIKKTVLELGGSNSAIVLEDADLEDTAEKTILSRYLNAGQSCIAAKRFIIVEGIYDEFLEIFTQKLKKLKLGDPMDENTDISCIARLDLAEDLEKQVKKSVEKGAKIHYGGKRLGTQFEPTILTDVKKGMPAFDEEIFGPVAAFIKVNNVEEAIILANSTEFGLGTMLFSKNVVSAKKLISKINDGAVFINDFVKSDPRLPFGGTKISGYGRELGKDGILEFVNRKTVYIH